MMTLQSAQTNIYKAIEQQDFSMLAESGNGTLEALRVFLATEILIEPGYTIAQYFVPKYNAHTRKFDSAAAAAATFEALQEAGKTSVAEYALSLKEVVKVVRTFAKLIEGDNSVQGFSNLLARIRNSVLPRQQQLASVRHPLYIFDCTLNPHFCNPELVAEAKHWLGISDGAASVHHQTVHDTVIQVSQFDDLYDNAKLKYRDLKELLKDYQKTGEIPDNANNGISTSITYLQYQKSCPRFSADSALIVYIRLLSQIKDSMASYEEAYQNHPDQKSVNNDKDYLSIKTLHDNCEQTIDNFKTFIDIQSQCVAEKAHWIDLLTRVSNALLDVYKKIPVGVSPQSTLQANKYRDGVEKMKQKINSLTSKLKANQLSAQALTPNEILQIKKEIRTALIVMEETMLYYASFFGNPLAISKYVQRFNDDLNESNS